VQCENENENENATVLHSVLITLQRAMGYFSHPTFLNYTSIH